MTCFSIIDHMSDVGIKVESNDLGLLFSDAIDALFFLITGKKSEEIGLDKLKICKKKILVRYSRIDDALIELLNRIIFLSYTRRELIFNPEIRIKKNKVIVQASVIIDASTLMEKEIKTATYPDISIKNKNDQYSSSIIFDI